MKNLLLILPLLFAPSLEATSRIDIMDYDSDTKISVYCIGGYAFTAIRSKDNGETSLTQIMRKHGPGGAMPMSCNEYMKTKPLKLWED